MERRYKERNADIKDAFIRTHDLRQPANVQKLKKLEDKLTLEHYALQEQNGLKRYQLKKQKYIHNK